MSRLSDACAARNVQRFETGRSRFSRRDALAMLSAMGLSIAMPGMSTRAASRRRDERPLSLITLFMAGGMSQLESFDPHAGKPAGGQTTSIATSIPGVQIASLLPQVAEQLHSTMLIRSLTSKEGDHERGTKFVKTGYRPEPTLNYPSLGAIAAHELNDPSIDIPQHISLGTDQFFALGGYLGNQWDAFRIFDPGRGLANLKPAVEETRGDERLKAMDVINRRFERRRQFAAPETLHRQTIEDAVRMMSSEQLKALVPDNEPESVIRAYGDSQFGRGCLVARRLVEVGVRAIEVTLPGFDTHVNNYNGHVTQCGMLDPALATLIAELRERDLLNSTIVLCISEFGRTPEINGADGRDHWPNWFSCLVAGGGFRHGVVVGETTGELPTDRKNARPFDPVTIPELYATILARMGIDPNRELMTPIGRPMRFADADPRLSLLTDEAAGLIKV